MDLNFVLIICSLICSAFFSAMELAFISANRLRIEVLKKNRAYELGKRVLEACNTSRFKAFTTVEATPKVIANATAEKISATCQKIILRNGRFIDLKLVEIVHNEITDDYVFRYDIQYEKPMFKRELKVTIDAENKVSALATKEIKNKPL